MSRVIEEKHICDRCGSSLKYPRLKMIVKRPIAVITTRWTDGTPYGYSDGFRELCAKCTNDFELFMMGGGVDE